MFKEVGELDAKTKLSELLRAVKQGQRFTITVRGKPVADLVPCQRALAADAEAAVANMRAMARISGVSGSEIASWIADGRR